MMICPVCGTSADEMDSLTPRCGLCGFEHAYIAGFASDKALKAWEEEAALKKEEYLSTLISRYASGRQFSFCDNKLAFYIPGAQEKLSSLILVDQYGIKEYFGACQYSATISLSNSALLYEDGHVESFGPDNQFGQSDTKKLKNIRHILATPHCTYAVTASGEVEYCGIPISDEVARWQDIMTLSESDGCDFIVGLKQDGTAVVAGRNLKESFRKTIEAWTDAVTISCASNAVVCLDKSGRVHFAGRFDDNERKQAEEWANARAVGIESIYTVGLTAEGQILLAGKQPEESLDAGRRAAAAWSDIIAISCNKFGIAALRADYTVLLAGYISSRDRLQKEWNENAAKLIRQEMKTVNRSSAM